MTIFNAKRSFFLSNHHLNGIFQFKRAVGAAATAFHRLGSTTARVFMRA